MCSWYNFVSMYHIYWQVSLAFITEPVCESQLTEEREQTTTDTVRITYTESTKGMFDNYTFRIFEISSANDSNLIHTITNPQTETDRAVIFTGLKAGTAYSILATTVSGIGSTSEQSDPKSLEVTTGFYIYCSILNIELTLVFITVIFNNLFKLH